MTRVYYVLKRDSVSPYLSERGRSFCDLGKTNFEGSRAMEFRTVRDAVTYLRLNNNIPDITEIVKITETTPEIPEFTIESVK